MKLKAPEGRKILYWIGALLVFVPLAWCLCKAPADSKQSLGGEVLFLGDSIIAQERGETSIPMLVAKETGGIVVNCAIGGTTLSWWEHGNDSLLGGTKGTLSMTALIQAVTSGDFGPQHGTKVRETVLSYVPYTVNSMESTDFEKADTLIFNHGVNDYHQGVPLDNAQNPYDTGTFGGALRQVLRTLRDKYPQLRVIYVTPAYSWYGENQTPCTEKDFGQGTLDEYVNLAVEICEAYRVEVVNVFEEGYGDDDPLGASGYTEDGLHPNGEGRIRIAKEILEVLNAE